MPAFERGPKSVTAGRLLREARRRHELGQAELAELAKTGQPAISRIERDAVSPTLDTLNRLFEAMGETLAVAPSSLADRPPGGGNESIRVLRAGYRELTAEERLEQATRLTEFAAGLAASAADR